MPHPQTILYAQQQSYCSTEHPSPHDSHVCQHDKHFICIEGSLTPHPGCLVHSACGSSFAARVLYNHLHQTSAFSIQESLCCFPSTTLFSFLLIIHDVAHPKSLRVQLHCFPHFSNSYRCIFHVYTLWQTNWHSAYGVGFASYTIFHKWMGLQLP